MLREMVLIAVSIVALGLLVEILESFIGWTAHLWVTGFLGAFFTVRSVLSLRSVFLNELSGG